MAIAHRTGIGKKIVIGDKSLANADTIVKIMNDAGMEMDLSSRKSIVKLIAETQKHSEISATLFTLIRWLSAAMKSALWRRLSSGERAATSTRICSRKIPQVVTGPRTRSRTLRSCLCRPRKRLSRVLTY